ncbi:MAG: alpha/beta fold hydrolase [bacterium]
MPYVSVNGVRFHYLDEGSDRAAPIIFLHGLTLDHRMFARQVGFFKVHYRVIVPDAKGHGLSDAPATGYSRRDRVHDLKGLLDELKIERFHLVGLSMGGSTGIGFALEFPERLASLTLISSGAAGYSIGKKIDRIDQTAREQGLEAARQKWREFSLLHFKGDREHLRTEIETMINEHSGAIWIDAMRGRYPREFDMERIHTISAPTLVISGKLDKVFTQLAGELAKNIPDSRLLTYPEVGHLVNLEAPDRLNRDLLAFLCQVDNPTG